MRLTLETAIATLTALSLSACNTAETFQLPTADTASPQTPQSLPTNVAAPLVAVSLSGQPVVTEKGSSVALAVTLTSEPSDDVFIDLSSSNPGEVGLSATRIVFDKSSWQTPRVVLATGVDDAIADGNQHAKIHFRPVVSKDAQYSGFTLDDVDLANLDDEASGLSVQSSGEATTTVGGSVTVSLRLQSEPRADVTLSVVSYDTRKADVTAGATLVFTKENWSVVQTATVTGRSGDPGSVGSYVVTVAGESDDDAYSGQELARVALTNQAP